MTNNNRNNRLKEIEVEASSGNVFADLGVANPEEWLAKAKLVQRIADGGRTHTFAVRRPGAKLKTCPSTNAATSSSPTARRFRGMGTERRRDKPEVLKR
jgi:hypothetical protein